MESRRCVAEAERHDEVFEETHLGSESGFPLVARLDAQEIVDLGKVFAALNAVEEVVDQRDGIAVLDGDGIESTVINAEAEFAVLLLDEKDGCGSRGAGWADETFCEDLCEVLLEFFVFAPSQRIDWSERCRLSRFKVDLHVVRSVGWESICLGL